MAIIYNDIKIKASKKKVWEILANLEALDKYDPIVTKSVAVTENKSGVGAERKCDTTSGWFREKVTVWNPESDLEFSIIACNQPMKNLTHTYRLDEKNGVTHVAQVMKYTMKFGIIGKMMDVLMGKRMADKQIKLFFHGLKKYAETGVGK